MDVKWLLISILLSLGVFRATHPALFSRWVKFRWREFESARMGFGISLFSLLFCSALCFIIGATFDLGIQSWKLAAGIAAVIVARALFTALLSALFSKNIKLYLTNIGPSVVPLSYVYAAVVVLGLVSTLVLPAGLRYGFYIIGFAHVTGLILYALTSPALQNIGNYTLRMYSFAYLCTLELVLMYSIVN